MTTAHGRPPSPAPSGPGERPTDAIAESRIFGLAIILSASPLMFVSAFMPKLRSLTIQLHSNRLIDSWGGVVLLTCSVTLIIAVALGWSWRHLSWLVWIVGLTALGVVVYDSTGRRLMLEGPSGVAGAIYAEQGIGLICAGLAAIMTIGGGLIIRSRKRGT